jgi:cell division protein FtsQ
MMPKPRPRAARRLGWPFRRRRNRRVRLTSGGAPSRLRPVLHGLGRRLASSARPALLVAIALAVGGAGWGLRRFLTRSPHFAVRALRFSPTRHVSTATLTARAGVALGSNLFSIDLDETARDVAQDPWVQSARARRELPSTIVVDIVEREAACVVALGPLYLADARGAVFKRASPEEAAALPAVTGIDRDRYLGEPEPAQAAIRQALSAVVRWQTRAERPRIGEAHIDRLLGLTLYTIGDRAHSALPVGVRLGHLDDSLDARLARFDAVWQALAHRGEQARLIYLDNRARPDRVTVKLAPGAPETRAAKPAEAAEPVSET